MIYWSEQRTSQVLIGIYYFSILCWENNSHRSASRIQINFASGQASIANMTMLGITVFSVFSAFIRLQTDQQIGLLQELAQAFCLTTPLKKNTPQQWPSKPTNYYRHAAHICMDNLHDMSSMSGNIDGCSRLMPFIYGIWISQEFAKNENRVHDDWTLKTKHASLKLACHKKCLDFENYAHLLLG